ncbi:ribosome-associated translation inhibitor RaiA [bacterium]|nr:ribosome-associated translation inhibitor RaiA [bacterium]
MRITITARRFKLQENIKNFTQRKVMRLEKFYNGIIDAEVILSWEKFYRMAEIKLRVYGATLTSQEREEDMRKAIKNAIIKIERQLVKYKDKLHDFDHEKGTHEPVTEAEDKEPLFESQEV